MKLRANHKGFTIIELLIATVAFSMVLLILTGAIIQFTRIYYNGNITSRTQESTRAALEVISKSAQYASDVPTALNTDPDSGVVAYCVGGKTYAYVTDQKAGTNEGSSTKGLSMLNGCVMPAPEAVNGGIELLGENMRVLDMKIQESSGAVTISLKVGYGDDVSASDDSKKRCPTISLGGQFCATAELDTTVVRRIGI